MIACAGRRSTPAEGRDGRGGSGEAGFTLIVVLIAVAVSSILLSAAVTTWTHVMKREAEEELIWRGEQYVRAIECYMGVRGVPPTELEQLVEARCIRRLYSQPLSKDGSWRVLRMSAPGVPTAAAAGGPGPGLMRRNLRSSEPIVGVAPGITGQATRRFDDSYDYESWEFVLGRDTRPPVRAIGLPEGFEPGQSLDEILERQRKKAKSGR